jgi:hypothetical protein
VQTPMLALVQTQVELRLLPLRPGGRRPAGPGDRRSAKPNGRVVLRALLPQL